MWAMNWQDVAERKRNSEFHPVNFFFGCACNLFAFPFTFHLMSVVYKEAPRAIVPVPWFKLIQINMSLRLYQHPSLVPFVIRNTICQQYFLSGRDSWVDPPAPGEEDVSCVMVLVILLFDSFCHLNSKIYFLGSVTACTILFYSYLWESIMGNMAGKSWAWAGSSLSSSLSSGWSKVLCSFPARVWRCIILDLLCGVKWELFPKSEWLCLLYASDSHL